MFITRRLSPKVEEAQKGSHHHPSLSSHPSDRTILVCSHLYCTFFVPFPIPSLRICTRACVWRLAFLAFCFMLTLCLFGILLGDVHILERTVRCVTGCVCVECGVLSSSLFLSLSATLWCVMRVVRDCVVVCSMVCLELG
jgi:hypothetical protein